MIKLSSTQYTQGEVWDHKGKTELVQIIISYRNDVINFLQFVYLENGSLVLSDRLGDTNHGSKFNTVTLNYPDEVLTSISGSYGSNYGKYVTSITFGTNQGNYGPFGQPGKDDEVFNFQMGQHRSFGGFHGSTYYGRLKSIGVYFKPIAALSDLNFAGKVKKESV